jgi:hypothetical protein
MKISKFALSAMIASACLGGTAFGQSNRTAPRYYPASYYSYQDGASTQAPAPITSASDSTTGTTASACCDNTPACDVAAICDGKSSCDSMGCGSTSVGCGLGGGDWEIVLKIINEVFENYNKTVYICNNE